MKNKLIFFTILLAGFLVNCEQKKLSETEKNICLQNFQEDLINFFPLFENSKNEEPELISTLNLILSDIELNDEIKNSKEDVLNLVNRLLSRSEEEKMKDDTKIIVDFIKLNIDKFKVNQMSLIEDLDFVKKVFLAYYWMDWRCDLSFGFDLNISSTDTIILYENEEYQIPIFVRPEKSNLILFEISSNSLQKDERDEIFIKTGNPQEEVINKKVEITAYNILTGEKSIKLDSILFRIIKRD